MRGFVVVWLVAFGVITMIASGITWYVAKNSPPPAPVITRQAISFESDQTTTQPFPEADAIEIIALRLPLDAAGEQARQKLQTSSTVTYHSPQHWRVCFDTACWVAHGTGRFAEPENDAARQLEARASVTPRR
jgi:hypothetical protein